MSKNKKLLDPLLRGEDLSAIFMGMIPLRSTQFPAVACERGREGGVGGLGRGAFCAERTNRPPPAP